MKKMKCKKKAYSTREIAERYLEEGKDSGHYSEDYTTYICLECMKYHIGGNHT